MLDGNLFDTLNSLAKFARKSEKPFGGIQIILSGDFFQLPPIGLGKKSVYCFQSKSWNEVVQV